MVSNYIQRLKEIGHRLRPMVKELRPLRFWHFTTCLVEIENGNHAAAHDLAEQIVEIIDASIDSCMSHGEQAKVRDLQEARSKILEGIS